MDASPDLSEALTMTANLRNDISISQGPDCDSMTSTLLSKLGDQVSEIRDILMKVETLAESSGLHPEGCGGHSDPRATTSQAPGGGLTLFITSRAAHGKIGEGVLTPGSEVQGPLSAGSEGRCALFSSSPDSKTPDAKAVPRSSMWGAIEDLFDIQGVREQVRDKVAPIKSLIAGSRTGRREGKEEEETVSPTVANARRKSVVVTTEGHSYRGGMCEGLMHGYGRLEWDDGHVYEGEFVQGETGGVGRRTWISGHSYIGEEKDSLKHGRGVFEWPDGKRYEGQFERDQRNGFGIMMWPSGKWYLGGWKDGGKDGDGIECDGEASKWCSTVYKGGNLQRKETLPRRQVQDVAVQNLVAQCANAPQLLSSRIVMGFEDGAARGRRRGPDVGVHSAEPQRTEEAGLADVQRELHKGQEPSQRAAVSPMEHTAGSPTTTRRTSQQPMWARLTGGLDCEATALRPAVPVSSPAPVCGSETDSSALRVRLTGGSDCEGMPHAAVAASSSTPLSGSDREPSPPWAVWKLGKANLDWALNAFKATTPVSCSSTSPGAKHVVPSREAGKEGGHDVDNADEAHKDNDAHSADSSTSTWSLETEEREGEKGTNTMRMLEMMSGGPLSQMVDSFDDDDDDEDSPTHAPHMLAESLVQQTSPKVSGRGSSIGSLASLLRNSANLSQLHLGEDADAQFPISLATSRDHAWNHPQAEEDADAQFPVRMHKDSTLLVKEQVSGVQEELWRAAREGNVAALTAAIDAGGCIIISARDEADKGNAALHMAAAGGHLACVGLLVAAGAEASAQNAFGDTAMHAAAFNGHSDIVEALAVAGGDFNAESEDGDTPLHCCAYKGHAHVCKALIGLNANINARSYTDKDTPMHRAAFGGHLEAVRVLLQCGACPDSLNADDLTPLDLAEALKHTSVIKEFASHQCRDGSDSSEASDEGPLYL